MYTEEEKAEHDTKQVSFLALQCAEKHSFLYGLVMQFRTKKIKLVCVAGGTH
jgi:hypothetical protein